MQGVEELTFSLGTVIQLVLFAVSIASGWAYLKKNFEAHSTRFANVENDIATHTSNVTQAIEKMSTKIDVIHQDANNHRAEMIKISGAGDVLATRVSALENERTRA